MSDITQPPAIERAASPVGRQRRFLKSRMQRIWAYAALGVGIVGFVLLGINAAMNQADNGRPFDTGSDVVKQVTSSLPVEHQQPVPEKSAVNQPPPGVAAGPVNYVLFPAGGGEGYFNVPSSEPGHEDKAAGTEKKGGEHDDGKTKVAFKASTLEGAKAGPAIRLTYVMMPQHIPCALDTAMDSTLAGGIECHTTQDVLSPDHVLLMPAGTQIVGTYHNDVKTGQHRLFAFAGNAITKEGIPVPLNSNIADGVGRTGVDGEVDNHYMERFGAAIILTMADSALQIAQTEVSKAGQTNLNLGGGGGSGIGGVADQVLRSQINIPPTIYVQPGTVVTVAVDHPISFEDALHVEAR